MTDAELLEKLEFMTGEHDQSVLNWYLQMAGEEVVRKCYPFDAEKTEVPARYKNVQLNVAVYLMNKRGAEGENYHSENGINRAYESAGVPKSLLQSVVPFAKVIG